MTSKSEGIRKQLINTKPGQSAWIMGKIMERTVAGLQIDVRVSAFYIVA
jgi:hypothetical protein